MMSSKTKPRKMPLPGVRQGIPGATARDDSMRTGGGGSVSCWPPTGLPEEDTVAQDDHSGTQELDYQTAPATSAFVLSTTSRNSKSSMAKKRMKWDKEMNEFIIRTYLRITRLETEIVGYRQQLHTTFITQYPTMKVTAQRIADQRRSIIKNNLIPEPVLSRIRDEVTKELQRDSESIPPGSAVSTSPETDVTTQDPSTPEAIISDNSDLYEKTSNEFHKALLEYSGTDPTQRPILPKQQSSKKFGRIIENLNSKVLPEYLKEHQSFPELHTGIYCAALTAVRLNNGKPILLSKKPIKKKIREPPWEKRLKAHIIQIRQDVNRLQQYKNGVRGKRLNNKVIRILKISTRQSMEESGNTVLQETLETLKQKLAALSKRLKRYQNTTERKIQNAMFTRNERQFYSNLEEKKHNTIQERSTPKEEEIYNYWSGIWSNPIKHNDEAHWIREMKDTTNEVNQMAPKDVEIEEVQQSIKKLQNWKAPGVDRIHNYYYKKFTCTHFLLAQHFQKFLDDPASFPDFLCTGITYLKPKSEDLQNPAKYRPITCLSTIYKIFTSVIANRILTHCEENYIIAEEQKGCKKNTKGCKEQLTIDNVVLEQAHKKSRNLFTCFIDYKKAFDSVPHTWLIHVMEQYKVDFSIINFLKTVMTSWNTSLQIFQGNINVTTRPIPIRRGIFQGDSLSPLWFCMALNPLSTLLNTSEYGFNIKSKQEEPYKISHLLYMDDIKLYASTKPHLQHLISITKTFSSDIGMQFGLDKCRTQTVTRGSYSAQGINLKDEPIQPLEEEEMYKYLGFNQSTRMKHAEIKRNVTQQYLARLAKVLSSKLTAKNLTKAVNTYAIPLLTYSFGVIKWSQTELQQLQTKTAVSLTRHRMHHPKSATERLTLPRSEGGRGFLSIVNLHNKQISSLREYFHSRADASCLHHAVCTADIKYTPLNLSSLEMPVPVPTTKETNVAAWKQKSLHGKYPYELDQPHIDKSASHAWLTYPGLFPETEGFVLAIQDQVIATRNYRRFIMNDPTVVTDKCRRCSRATESIQHIISGCPHLANSDYKHRHDQVAKIIYQKLSVKCGFVQTPPTAYWKYTPPPVLENSSYKLLWDRDVITDVMCSNNRPDIILIDKEKRSAFLIEIACPNTSNLQTTIATKISKYTELAIEIQRMWKLESVTTVPIVISCTGVIPKSLHSSLAALNLHRHTFIELQKATLLSTCHTVRKFLGATFILYQSVQHEDPSLSSGGIEGQNPKEDEDTMT